MKLSQPVKLGVGLATAFYILVPFVLALLWFMFVFTIPFIAVSAERSGGDLPPAFMLIPLFMGGCFFPVQCVLILLSLGLIAFYLTHNIKNRTGVETVRVLLALGTVFLPLIGMPIYYFIYVWPDRPPDWAVMK